MKGVTMNLKLKAQQKSFKIEIRFIEKYKT
jgi:hypothetical protein